MLGNEFFLAALDICFGTVQKVEPRMSQANAYARAMLQHPETLEFLARQASGFWGGGVGSPFFW